jgi:WD40 repeat protein/serine/threonine protein kinase
MAVYLACPGGHVWDGDTSERCPQCGAGGALLALQDTGPLSTVEDVTGPYVPPAPRSRKLPTVAGYEVLGELGRGGMGLVYQARQVGLDRLVALKMIKAGAHAGVEELERFRAEAQALARLQHPGIVQIYEVGEHEGQPYFALELVGGGSLKARLGGTPQPAQEAAQLTAVLADAVHAAHQAGVVHRDLKPGNILLQEDLTQRRKDAKEDLEEKDRERTPGSALLSSFASLRLGESSFLPKITDFGLAKRLDGDSLQTQSGAILGTPSYMAPEQAVGRPELIGPAADVYGLGAILYDLLTGRPPFRGAAVLDTLEQVRSQEPVPPRRLQPKVPHDLETICLKCLRKDPGQRYASAFDLAGDLRRYLAGEPIQARPTSHVERLAKWARRNPRLAVLCGAFAAAFLVGLALMGAAGRKAEIEGEQARIQEQAALGQAIAERAAHTLADEARGNADEEQLRAIEARNQAEAGLIANHLHLAAAEWKAGHAAQAEELLDRCPPSACLWEWHYLKRQFHTEQLLLPGFNGVVFSPDGTRLAAPVVNGTIVLRDATTGAPVLTLRGHIHGATHVAFRPDGQRLVSTGSDNTVRIWDTTTGQQVFAFTGHNQVVMNACFIPDGARVASASTDGIVKVWEAASGAEVFSRTGRVSDTLGLAFSPDGKYLAWAGADQCVKVCDAATGQERRSIRQRTAVLGIAFSPDSKRLASAGLGMVNLWDLETGKLVVTFHLEGGWILDVAFSPDGRRMAATSSAGAVQVWDTADGGNTLLLRGHTGMAFQLSFSPDGRRLATWARNQEIRVWDLTVPPEARVLVTQPAEIWALAFSPDGKRVASVDHEGVARVSQVATGREVLTMAANDSATLVLAFSADGRRLATGGGEADQTGVARVWDTVTGRELFRVAHARTVESVDFSPDGTLFAFADDNETRICDGTTGKEIHRLPNTGRPLAFSPDGRTLATATRFDEEETHDRVNDIRLWEVGTWREGPVLQGFPNFLFIVAFSPDGKLLLAAGGEARNHGEMRAWEVGTGKQVFGVRGHANAIFQAAFAPGGRRIASAGMDGQIKLWDPAAGRELLTLSGHRGPVLGVAFSPDGSLLASCGKDGTIRLWDGTPADGPRTLRGHTGLVHGIAFSSDGKVVAAGGTDSTVTLFDAATFQSIRVLHGHTDRVRRLAFSTDGTRLASAGWDGTARIWDVRRGQELHTLRGHNGEVIGLAYAPDGRHVVTAGIDNLVKIWEAETGTEVRTLTGHSAYVMSVEYSPDGRWLASTGGDRCIKIWEAETGKELLTIPWGTVVINDLAFSPDGRLLVAAGGDGEVKVWELKAGATLSAREVTTYRGHNGPAFRVSFSPDGKRVASGGLDVVVHIWEALTGAEVGELTGHTEAVQGIAFSPDGRRLAATGADEILKLWPLPPAWGGFAARKE